MQTFSPDSLAKIERTVSAFGPDYKRLVIEQYAKSLPISQAVESHAPTFHQVTNFFSREATLFWLRLHIAQTFIFLGLFDSTLKYQIQETANLILNHEIFGQLTLAEFLCFLDRFKLGTYGKIYRANPQELLTCLTPFWRELSIERGRAEEKKKMQEVAEPAPPPTAEQTKLIEEIRKRLSERFSATKEGEEH